MSEFQVNIETLCMIAASVPSNKILRGAKCLFQYACNCATMYGRYTTSVVFPALQGLCDMYAILNL